MEPKVDEKIKSHIDYKEEIKRLDYTKSLLEKTIKSIEEFKEVNKGDIRHLLSEDEKGDSSQAYISLLIANNVLEMAEKNYYSYRKAKDKPYFARIDFKLEGDTIGASFAETENGASKIYIGKTSLYDADKDEQTIVDWRAPIANIYYEGRLGTNTYSVGDETLKGEMLLKRQYTVEKGVLTNFMDIDITTTDSFLQASLTANADNRLKDIASTIQGEQNRVIRADLNSPLIVQGVAGSGKTTIALHRVAYFIYTYEKTFDPENYMIIAPNNLFINYISEVLPELGVERVKQTTYEDFVFELIGKKYRLASLDEKLVFLIHSRDEEKKELIKWESKFKGSLEFRDIIDNYIKDIENNFVPREDFKFENIVFFTWEDVNRIFLNDLSYLPPYKRIKELKKSLNNKLKAHKENILKQLEYSYDRKLDYIRYKFSDTEDKRQTLIMLMDERDRRLKEAEKTLSSLISDYLAKFPDISVFDYYGDLITNAKNIKKYSDNKLPDKKVKFLVERSRELLSTGKVEFEDLAPLAYLQAKVIGFSKKIPIRNVIIDEAQDFSLFQFYALKSILDTRMFTILGDISQGIHSYRGIENWQDVMDGVFEKDNPGYVTMEQSYRTTVEIMELANKVIEKYKNKNIILAKPVIRHGEVPELKSFDEEKELLPKLADGLNKISDEEFRSIAVICKTEDECKRIKKYLDKNTNIKSRLINGKEKEYAAGVVLLPCHLAKGLEFDAVFIVNIDESYDENDLDIKLLYVSMTRALHRLYIYQIKDKIKLV